MKYQEKVESAQSEAQVEFDSCVGDILDSTKEQQEDDCMDEGTHDPEQFMALDPDDQFGDDKFNSKAKDSLFKKITENQVLKNLHSQNPHLLLFMAGQAGCGKSFVINLMTQ